MRWVVSHQSALEFWRRANAKEALSGKVQRTIKLSALPPDVKKIQDKNYWDLTIPLHIMVGSANARKVIKSLHCHVSKADYQNHSFVLMNSGLIVCSPELCFLQMAGEISFIELVKLGYEFCGIYRLDKTIIPKKSIRKDLPLTSVDRLISYAEKSILLEGRINALRALSFVADGAASPMETILTILLTLPYRFGGYGFQKPQLNFPIEVSAKIKKSEVKSIFRCDLYWQDKKVGVEYDSDEFHTGSERIAEDAIRRNALSSTGVTIITVSRMQITESAGLSELAEVLSKLLGKRLKCQNTEFKYCQVKLMNQLMPWISKRR